MRIVDNALTFLHVAYIAVSIVLLVTCWRLWRFFRGGAFSRTWKILSVTAVFFLLHSITCLADIFFTGGWIIYFHEALQLIFVVFLTYGVWTFHQAWAKLGKQ